VRVLHYPYALAAVFIQFIALSKPPPQLDTMNWLRLDPENNELHSSNEARRHLSCMSRKEPLGLIAIFGKRSSYDVDAFCQVTGGISQQKKLL